MQISLSSQHIMDHEKKEPLDTNAPEEFNEQQVPSHALRSEFSKKYDQFFQDHLWTHEDVKQSISQLLERQTIRYSDEDFYEELIINIDHDGFNSRIVSLKVAWGHFRFILNLFLEEKPSPTHYCRQVQGTKGVNIYLMEKVGIKEAIKCYEFGQMQTPVEIFVRALKECCICKIASGLGVGPLYTKLAGFDLVLYPECIEFSMQLCQQLNDTISIMEVNDVLKLKRKLSLLHNLKIVHMDIKPANIMFSSKRKEIVFIDFGFSKMIKEQIGRKTYSHFLGSLNYCSEEMKKSFGNQNKEGVFVDLFYNDAYSLEVSLDEIMKDMAKRVIQEERGYEYDIEMLFQMESSLKKLNIIRLKSQIYDRNPQILKEPIFKSILLNNSSQFLNFLSNIPFSNSLADLYTYIIPLLQNPDDKKAYFIQFQYKRSSIFRDQERQQSTTHSDFLSKLNLDQKFSVNLSISDQKVRLIIFEDIKQKISDPKIIKSLSKWCYYETFLDVVDIRTCITNFKEKQFVSNLLKEQKQQSKDNGTETIKIESSFKQLEMALKIILRDCLSEGGKKLNKIIPDTIINLVLLEALSGEELLRIVDRACELDMQPLEMTILLLRVYQQVDWIKYKIVSRYHDLQFEITFVNSLIRYLKKLKLRGCPCVIDLIIDVISHKDISSLTSVQCESLLKHLKIVHKIEPEVAEEIIVFAIFQRQNSKPDKRTSNLSLFISLSMFNSNILKVNRITPMHLRLLDHQYSFKSLSSCLTSVIYSCFQQQAILSQFKMCYSQDHFNFRNFDLDEKIQILLKACREKGLLYTEQIITNFQTIVTQVERKKLQKYINSIENVFSTQYLDHMEFPRLKFSNFLIFFHKSSKIINIFYKLYPKNSQQLCSINTFLQKLGQCWSTIECFQCKYLCYHFLLSIQIKLLSLQQKIIEILELSASEIRKMQKEPNNQRKIYLLAQYIKIISFCLNDYSYKTKKVQKYFGKIVFRGIVQNRLCSVMFLSERGYTMFCFIMNYIFRENIDAGQFFIKFHLQMTRFLEEYPCKEFIVFYKQAVVAYTLSHIDLIRPHTEQILGQYFRLQHIFNPHISLLLCFLIKTADTDFIFFRKTFLSICHLADMAISLTKFFSLQSLFSDGKAIHFLCPNLRSRRRKILTFSAYFNPNINFSLFLQALGLSSLRKIKKNVCISRLLHKMMLFYNNQFKLHEKPQNR